MPRAVHHRETVDGNATRRGDGGNPPASAASLSAASVASSPIGRSSSRGSRRREQLARGPERRRHVDLRHAQRPLGHDPLQREHGAQVTDRAPGLRRGLPGEAGVLLEPARDRGGAQHRRHRLGAQPAERVGGEVLRDQHAGSAGLVDGEEGRRPVSRGRHQVRQAGARQAGERDQREPHGVERERARGGVEAAVVQRVLAGEQRVLGGGVDLDGEDPVQRLERLVERAGHRGQAAQPERVLQPRGGRAAGDQRAHPRRDRGQPRQRPGGRQRGGEGLAVAAQRVEGQRGDAERGVEQLPHVAPGQRRDRRTSRRSRT